uniref:Uncharacterized protein n=1 Tax=Rhizophora mucronata TaxID=61149 RepID=A0A2P2MVQ0_RHIMU
MTCIEVKIKHKSHYGNSPFLAQCNHSIYQTCGDKTMYCLLGAASPSFSEG